MIGEMCGGFLDAEDVIRSSVLRLKVAGGNVCKIPRVIALRLSGNDVLLVVEMEMPPSMVASGEGGGGALFGKPKVREEGGKVDYGLVLISYDGWGFQNSKFELGGLSAPRSMASKPISIRPLLKGPAGAGSSKAWVRKVVHPS